MPLPRSSFDTKPNDDRCTVCNKACAIKQAARNAKSHAARAAAAAALKAASSDPTVYDAKLGAHALETAACAARTTPRILKLLGAPADTAPTHLFFSTGVPGSAEFVMPFVWEEFSAVMHRTEVNIRPSPTSYFTMAWLKEHVALYILAASDETLNAAGSTGIEGLNQRLHQNKQLGERAWTDINGGPAHRVGHIYLCILAVFSKLPADVVFKPDVRQTAARAAAPTVLLTHKEYLAERALFEPGVLVNLLDEEADAFWAKAVQRREQQQAADFAVRVAGLAGSPYERMYANKLVAVVFPRVIYRALSVVQAEAVVAQHEAGETLTLAATPRITSHEQAEAMAAATTCNGSTLSPDAKLLCFTPDYATALQLAKSGPNPGNVVISFEAPHALSPRLLAWSMAASPLLPAATRANALNEVHVAASAPFAVTLEYAHGVVFGDRVLTTWNGLFQDQTFLASGCDISKFKAQVEAAGGRIVTDTSDKVTVLVSEDKSKRSRKNLFALNKKLPIISEAQFKAALESASTSASKAPSTVVSEAASRHGSIVE